MKSFSLIISILLLGNPLLFSQVSINNDSSPADNSAMLDVKSSDKGVLIPRMSYSAIYAIENPAEGLMVFCMDCGTDCEGFIVIYSDGAWNIVSIGCLPPKAPLAGSHITSMSQIVWTWYSVAGATGYKWNTVNNPSTAIDVGTSLTYTETGLLPNTAYTRYVWSYNTCGHSPVNGITAQTLPAAIGASFGGGIIFYVDGTGSHGLISAVTDQSTGAPWGCSETLMGGTSTEIGTGQANTTIIVTGCIQPGIAALICQNLELNGYNDWFLPSRDELYQMYLQKTVIGGFSNANYYSSSECNAYTAWGISFNGGSQSCLVKNISYRVRAIRAF